MTPILLDNVTFWDVVWWMIMVFFLTMVIWMFIAIFADIFRRRDLKPIMKIVWICVIFLIPFIGILIYVIARPHLAQDDEMVAQMQAQQQAAGGYSSADEIAKAQQLLSSGAITQAEFDAIKAKALA